MRTFNVIYQNLFRSEEGKYSQGGELSVSIGIDSPIRLCSRILSLREYKIICLMKILLGGPILRSRTCPTFERCLPRGGGAPIRGHCGGPSFPASCAQLSGG